MGSKGSNRVQMTGVRVKPVLIDRLKALHLEQGKRLDRSNQPMAFSRFVERILEEYAYERHKVAVLKDKEWDLSEFE